MSVYSAIKAWVASCSEALAGRLARMASTLPPSAPDTSGRSSISGPRSAPDAPDLMSIDLEPLVQGRSDRPGQGQGISIPSRRYKLGIFAARRFPRAAVRAVSRRMCPAAAELSPLPSSRYLRSLRARPASREATLSREKRNCRPHVAGPG